MHIRFGYEISIECPHAVVMFLALCTHPDGEPRITGQNWVQTDPYVQAQNFSDQYANRITKIVAPPGPLRLWVDVVAQVDGRPDAVFADARQTAVEDLPFDTLHFLMPSRYCDSDKLYDHA